MVETMGNEIGINNITLEVMMPGPEQSFQFRHLHNFLIKYELDTLSVASGWLYKYYFIYERYFHYNNIL